MKSITIHKLDDEIDALIRKKAKMEGTSLNQTIKKILAESLLPNPGPSEGNREAFMDLFGVWTDDDITEFREATKDFETIDPAEWE